MDKATKGAVFIGGRRATAVAAAVVAAAAVAKGASSQNVRPPDISN